LLASQELTLSTIFASVLTPIPTHTIRIITHTAMATIIPTTAEVFLLGVDTMIVARSVAASAGAATSVVEAEDMASVVEAEDMASAVVAVDTAAEATGKRQR
jgi:hypothetical protein